MRNLYGRNGGMVIIACEEIEPDEEITYHYGKDYFLMLGQRQLRMYLVPQRRRASGARREC